MHSLEPSSAAEGNGGCSPRPDFLYLLKHVGSRFLAAYMDPAVRSPASLADLAIQNLDILFGIEGFNIVDICLARRSVPSAFTNQKTQIDSSRTPENIVALLTF